MWWLRSSTVGAAVALAAVLVYLWKRAMNAEQRIRVLTERSRIESTHAKKLSKMSGEATREMTLVDTERAKDLAELAVKAKKIVTTGVEDRADLAATLNRAFKRQE